MNVRDETTVPNVEEGAMREYDPKFQRLATVLWIRGFALLAFGAIAVRWPEQSLADAVRYAGGIAVFLGIVELGMAMAGDALLSTRSFRIGHALTSIGFGLVSGAVTVLSLDAALTLVTLWFGAYAAFLLLLAARLSYFRRIRDALLLWGTVNATAVVICATMRSAPRVTMLLLGALYTAVLGAVTILAARWTRRGWMAVEHVSALP